MDTRSKIVEWPEARARFEEQRAEGNTPILVSGYFDPLLAPHAESLRRLARGRPVWVIVHDPPEPILPLRARAELVAALRTVERVILGDEAVIAEARQLAGENGMVAEEAAHLQFRKEFARRVIERHLQGEASRSQS
ncbi:MAG: hypothetical protein H5T84_06070 [Thermoleophilia bacterium]|nr:hypothetical protein [Thermoleophilia bacterium]